MYMSSRRTSTTTADTPIIAPPPPPPTPNYEITTDQVIEKFGGKSFAVLKMAFDSTIMPSEIIDLYKQNIEAHNTKQYTDPYPDAGFDLLVTKEYWFEEEFATQFIDFGVKTEMLYWYGSYCQTAFDMVPRSSISKTPLMMANHIGIIDSGYRGNLIGAFRNMRNPDDSVYFITAKTRIAQVCHPSRCPIYVLIVNESDLSSTSRGAGGFGSTGV